ncbi:hypothetical protein C454_11713 [Haloferax gibbonsii ATCC 33959]|uniref:Uncharacterized protein n=1 Tax=Haloferax gibbonsii (strain ATCC 33959 / DSM 4427 / JCM 8863 / NBRC 102184 / NCIMB 2188 / Ma 2.38) TaxID=1227459 RepID=M0H7R9_HALGM|nr:hypothetical protein [Haloferax gibbonsii]ELZ79868.1 hypothetical protein C454_11713 [Haloferax gibbonsii ATCC 33959]
MRKTKLPDRAALAVLAALVCLSAVAPPVVAATDTTVGFDADAATVEPDSTRTFDIVVDSADAGVGAYNLTVELDDASVGRITEVATPDGTDPRLRDVSYDERRTAASIGVIGLDTDDAGSVAVATVTVETADATGDGALDVSVSALGDEDGNSYTVTDTSGLDLSVSESSGGGGSGGGGSGGDDDPNDGGDDGDGPDSGSDGDSDADDESDDATDQPATTESASQSPAPPASTASPTATDGAETTPQATTQSATATETTTERRTTATGVPGFGVAPAVAAIAAFLFGFGRRARRED